MTHAGVIAPVAAPARARPRLDIRALAPGLLLAAAGAILALVVTRGTAVSPVLPALVVGMVVASLPRARTFEAGGAFATSTLLRLGVVFMGAKIDLALVSRLGFPAVGLTLAALVITLGVGMGVARLFGLKGSAAFLTAASVAICGASAALTLGSIQPRDDRSDRRLGEVIVLVTLIGSAAMLLYPWLAARLGLNDVQTGVFLGSTLHELALAAGAGASVSPDVGVMAVAVKLVRVACLAPIGMALALWLQSRRGETAGAVARGPLVPPFLIGFVLLAVARNIGLLSGSLVHGLSDLGQACLLAAMVGLGLRMSLRKLVACDARIAGAILAQSALLAGVVLAALLWAPALFGAHG